MDVLNNLRTLIAKRLTPNFLLSYSAFLLFMMLDMFTTVLTAHGDWSMEGNTIARWWYENMGALAVLEIPMWSLSVLVLGYIIFIKSEFLAVSYFNGLALGHLMGWLTWTSYYLYVYKMQSTLGTLLNTNQVYHIPLGVYGMALGVLAAAIQIRLFAYVARRKPALT